ncbi:MAG: hypothetical protein EYX74_06720 [Desulfobulbaceae bacterium]|nr:MAG: hypothetical protein EYX74_06720 [Desulfobulbaceae bacterium]
MTRAACGLLMVLLVGAGCASGVRPPLLDADFRLVSSKLGWGQQQNYLPVVYPAAFISDLSQEKDPSIDPFGPFKQDKKTLMLRKNDGAMLVSPSLVGTLTASTIALPGAFDQVAVESMVDELLATSRGEIHDGYSVAVATPVNLRNLYATSSFGRVLGERLLGGLQRAGVEMVDVRKTPALLIRERHGEFGLSRDMDKLSFVVEAQAVLVGTYTATAKRVLVDLRILRNRDNRVLASIRRDFAMDSEISALLSDEVVPAGPATVVPVRSYHHR